MTARGARPAGAVLAGLVLLASAAGAGEITGNVQATFVRSAEADGTKRELDREQVRLYLRDYLLVKSEWTIEYGFDRTHDSPGGSPITRPRYGMTLKGVGYLVRASFVPTRDPAELGGAQNDEWRGSLSVSGGGWPQVSVNYVRRDDRSVEKTFLDTWIGNLSYQHGWLRARTNIQRRREEAPMRGAWSRSLTGEGDLAVTGNLGPRLRTAANYEIALAERTGSSLETTTRNHTLGGSLGWTIASWASFSGTGNARWGKSGRSGVETELRERRVSTSLQLIPLSPLEVRLSYLRSRLEGNLLATLEEKVLGSLFARLPIGEQLYASGQLAGGRQLASTAGRYDFVSTLLETGGRLYRATQYRMTLSVQRNTGTNGQALPLQTSRQVHLETEPYQRLRASASYSAAYTGPTKGGLGSDSEVYTWTASVQPRGFGNWSLNYTRSWTRLVGTNRYLTLYASMRSRRGWGLNGSYTRRERPGNIASGGQLVDSLQGGLEVELRNGLIVGLTRNEAGVGRAGGRVEWQLNARYSF